MAKLDPAILAHLEWIGFIRPTGLVVSAPALVRAGAILDRRDAEGQRALSACVEERIFDAKEGPVPHLPDFRSFAESVLGWSFSPKGYAGTGEIPIPSELEVPLPDDGETLRPDIAVRELDPKDGGSPWQLVVRTLEAGEDFDRVARGNGQLEASAHGRMERLLRHTGVPAGLLFNGRALRLLSAPRGESSGWLDFRVADMVQTAGRPISTALRLLLREQRLRSLPRTQSLSALLEDSRKFQNEVSERLAEQVLHALYELLRGFQAAHDASKGELLHQPLAERPDEVYREPATVHAARFIGDANIWTLPVESGRVRTPLGDFPTSDGATTCTVVIRPEDLQVQAGGVPGEVISREYYGHDQVLLVRLKSGVELRVRLAPHERLGPAGPIALGLRRDPLLLPGDDAQ